MDEKIKFLAGEIIKSEYPEQFSVFRFECDSVLAELKANGGFQENSQYKQVNGFGLPSYETLRWIPIIYASYSIIKLVFDTANVKKKEELKSEFRKELEEGGLSKEEAEKIAEKYSTSILKLISRNKK